MDNTEWWISETVFLYIHVISTFLITFFKLVYLSVISEKICYNNNLNESYLHMQRQMSVETMIMTAATEAPMATPRTSPSISHCAP